MTTTTQSDAEIIAEVLAAEDEHNRAIDASDREALALVLGDDFTNQHSNGTTEDKEQKLNRCSSASHTTYTRGDLLVRVYNGTVVMTGDIDIHFPARGDAPGRVGHSVAIQVWVKRDGRWQLVAMQTAAKPEA